MELLDLSWTRAWAGVAAQPREGLREALLAAYAQPQHHYHSVQHLQECLAHFDAVRAQAQHPAEIELALWFHDAVYDPQAADNEWQSAQWARREMEGAGVDPAIVQRVDELIMATRHDTPPRTPDGQWLVDIDLAILGADGQRFAQYEAQVRREYDWVPAAVFRDKRRQLLQAFLDRPAIYGTPWFRERLEDRARANLAAAIAQ